MRVPVALLGGMGDSGGVRWGSTCNLTVKHASAATSGGPMTRRERMATDFDNGFLIGILVGEGHFGGDGRQPQVTLRMHERHEALFRWLERTFTGGRLYGPYEHSGRRYYQWMARGAYLRDVLVPLLQERVTPALDRYAHERFVQMCVRYSKQLGLMDASSGPVSGGASPGDTSGRDDAGSRAPSDEHAGPRRAMGGDGAVGDRTERDHPSPSASEESDAGAAPGPPQDGTPSDVHTPTVETSRIFAALRDTTSSE